jgi:hypothetical protein
MKKRILFRLVLEPLFSVAFASVIYFAMWLALSFLALEFMTHNWSIWRTTIIVMIIWSMLNPVDLDLYEYS